MPYYYGGYGDFLANNIYVLLLIPVMILSLWAQTQVSGNFKKYSSRGNPPSVHRGRGGGGRPACQRGL